MVIICHSRTEIPVIPGINVPMPGAPFVSAYHKKHNIVLPQLTFTVQARQYTACFVLANDVSSSRQLQKLLSANYINSLFDETHVEIMFNIAAACN